MLDKLSFENQVNVFGGVVVALIGVYVLVEVVMTRDNPACMSGYPAYTQMSFVNSKGTPLDPAELQARIGFGERGVLERGSIVSDGPSGLAFNVNVGAANENAPAVSFNWAPSNLNAAVSACLSYSFFLPRDFNFSQGGYLPGLFGDASKGTSSSQAGFSSRPHWVANGFLQMENHLSSPAVAQAGATRLQAKEYTLPRGRWVRIDQEVILNYPNTQNGQHKVWVDGKLLIHEKNVAWRGHAGVKIAGVGADVGYAPMTTNILPTRQAASIRFSPFQLGWKSEDAKTSSK
ncbi:MAG: polysaccharide lyase [Hyphomicrobiaceae bacterium]|nr:polysaccharide lyase [Hyphomicrobiaceae bacterium]